MSTLKDEQLKAWLEEISKEVPRYLFRMYTHRSGGDARLNTSEHITPLAFLLEQGHDSINEMTRNELRVMISGHLCRGRKDRSVNTGFSSWSVSPHFALTYATTRTNSDPYICIIDTDKLDQDNPAYHVPQLEFLAKDSSERTIYTACRAEYLIYGVIPGSAYKAVLFRDMKNQGPASQLPIYQRSRRPYRNQGILSESSTKLTEAEISRLSNIAILFGDSFRIPVLVHSSERRKWADQQDISTHVLVTIARFIKIGQIGEAEG